MDESIETQSGAVVVLSTCPPEMAGEIARRLVERRLAACVNVVEKVTSVYRWEGKLCEDAESLLVIKTTRARFDDLVREVLAVHPYSVPEVVALPVTAGSARYLDWVSGETAR
jgi:periplasmic divalent cation tolerance protein